MGRLYGINNGQHFPVMAHKTLDVMKEGHDCSEIGLFMADLGGEMGSFKGSSILSGVFTPAGIRQLDLAQGRQNTHYAVTTHARAAC